ncbi:hypothetical protein [Bosea sp. AS-1]|uniref:hypothetical protein n=1 Tax=Bosea sp. AS-1 TaxID=2015316 RepID=UPI000B78B575|nr:hypothetical protein [Bosea sp. AS-1]
MTDIIDKMNRAGEIAGEADGNWNRRYVAALNSLGLYLSWWPEGEQPDGLMMAPIPHSEGWQYQYPSYVTTE